jgi:hypothetical protein
VVFALNYQQDSFQPALKVNSITFCSCIPVRTEIEQTRSKRETIMVWAKDAVAGVGLVLFMAASFVLANGAQGLLSGW